MKYLSYEEFEKANIFGKGSLNEAFAQYFIGNSFLNPLTNPKETAVSLANVTFEPGCRNNWHIHHASSGGGQILICTAGEGWYVEKNKPPVSLTAGTVITIPPAVRSFLDSYDLSGKTIMPFCTSGSSGIGGSLSKIRELAPDSTVTEGFRGTASTTSEEINEWLDSNGYVKPETNNAESAAETRVRLSWEDHEAVIVMEDNATTQDFLSKLPMTVTFEDYNNTEKISYLEETLAEDEDAAGCTPVPGTFALYAPWGNLSIFYQDWSYSDDLIPMGEVETGLDALAGMDGDFKVVIEKAE